jgi:hypothetical protein
MLAGKDFTALLAGNLALTHAGRGAASHGADQLCPRL